MTNRLYDTSYVDGRGNQVVWSNDTKLVSYYSCEGESWDIYGGTSSSWYLENYRPTDFFYSTDLADDKWSYFSYRGTISGSVSSGLTLGTYGKEVRGGVTSYGKWTLSGIFDIRLYIDENSYYNEYRSNVAVGLSVSKDSSYKYRVSKYFDGSSIGAMSHYVEGKELKYYSWFNNGSFVSTEADSSVSCLRIVRDASGVSSYVDYGGGFVQVGSTVSGLCWEKPLYVELELEAEQANTVVCRVEGVSISGSVIPSTMFSSKIRGVTQSFPGETIFVVDSLGLSVVDLSDSSLWMRFDLDSGAMFRDVDCKISAGEGKIYYTSTQGLNCIDFSNDTFYRYIKGKKQTSSYCIVERNFDTILYDSISMDLLPDNQVNDVFFRKFNGTDYLAVTTVSGLDILVDDFSVYSSLNRNENISNVFISPAGKLLWSSYSQDSNTGKLYALDDISAILTGGGVFNYSVFYDSDTTPISLSSEKINSIFCSIEGEIVLANEFGIDYINNSGSVSFGPINSINPLSSPSFESFLGVDWHLLYSSVLPKPLVSVSRSSSWKTNGSYSLKLSSISGGYYVSNYSGGVYQQVDFSLIDKLYFDIKVVNTTGITSNIGVFEVLCGGSVLLSVNSIEGSFIKYNYSIDCSSINSVGQLVFRLRYLTSIAGVGELSYYVDNVRVFIKEPDYNIIPTRTHEVLSATLFEALGQKKIYFSCKDGYGAIDVDTNTLDYYTYINDFVQGGIINKAEYAIG